MRTAAAIAVMLLLGACGRGVDATGATPSESRQLNDAADVLDANSITLNAVEADDTSSSEDSQ